MKIIKEELQFEESLKQRSEFICEFAKVKPIIDIINKMDIKDKLRLAIRMSESNYTNLKYDKPEMYERFNNKLREIDEDYKTTIINYSQYPIVTFAMAKIMEISKEKQNQIVLYLFNNIKLEK